MSPAALPTNRGISWFEINNYYHRHTDLQLSGSKVQEPKCPAHLWQPSPLISQHARGGDTWVLPLAPLFSPRCQPSAPFARRDKGACNEGKGSGKGDDRVWKRKEGIMARERTITLALQPQEAVGACTVQCRTFVRGGISLRGGDCTTATVEGSPGRVNSARSLSPGHAAKRLDAAEGRGGGRASLVLLFPSSSPPLPVSSSSYGIPVLGFGATRCRTSSERPWWSRGKRLLQAPHHRSQNGLQDARQFARSFVPMESRVLAISGLHKVVSPSVPSIRMAVYVYYISCLYDLGVLFASRSSPECRRLSPAPEI